MKSKLHRLLIMMNEVNNEVSELEDDKREEEMLDILIEIRFACAILEETIEGTI